MATSLFGHDRARNAVQKPFSNPLNSGNQKEIEEQIRLENEALLDSLSNSVLRMKSVAGGLGREVNEQNSLLNSLGGAFTAAKSGVKTSVEHLTNVALVTTAMFRRLTLAALQGQKVRIGSAMGSIQRFQTVGAHEITNSSSTTDENIDSLDAAFDFALDELCDEISGDMGMYIPDLDFSLLGNENSKETK